MKEITAIFINFDGLTRRLEIYWDGREIYYLPKYEPIKFMTTKAPALDVAPTIQKMTFRLEYFNEDKRTAIFRQIE